MYKTHEFPGETKNQLEFPEETKLDEVSVPAKTEQLTGVDFYVAEIGKRTLKTTDDVFDLADFYLRASKELNVSQQVRMMRLLRVKREKGKSYGKSIPSKYRAIASDLRLRKEPLRSLLPPSYTIIYEISRLTSDELHLALQKGIIRPDVRKSEIQALLKKDFTRSSRVTLFNVLQHSELSAPRKMALQKSLRELMARYPEIGMASNDPDWQYRSSAPNRKAEPWTGNMGT